MSLQLSILISKSNVAFQEKACQAACQRDDFDESNWWKPALDTKFQWMSKSSDLEIQFHIDSEVALFKNSIDGVPLFFENQTYQFMLKGASEDQELLKSLSGWQYIDNRALYHFKPGNNVGWSKFKLSEKLSFRFLTYPTKVNYWCDYKSLQEEIEKEYPFWIYTLEGSSHLAGIDKSRRSSFLLLWFQQFKTLWEDFSLGTKQIIQNPHHRLMEEKKFVRADRIKKRVSNKLAEKITEDVHYVNQYDNKYMIRSKSLNHNTPENRFIKHILITSKRSLSQIHQLVTKQFPKSLALDDIDKWNRQITNQLQGSFLASVTNPEPLLGESLVLQQRLGYSKVYRIWNELKFYLDFFNSNREFNLRSIDQLYEIWTFIEVKKVLSELGFVEQEFKRKVIFKPGNFQQELKDGQGSAYHLLHGDGTKIEISHEPRFGKSIKKKLLKSYTTVNKPDIMVHVKFPNKKQLIWLFDAKYRVYKKGDPKSEGNDYDEHELNQRGSMDLVPPDALNQMHRYRDVLIHETKDGDKIRPIVGGFCLYPGYYPVQRYWEKASAERNGMLGREQIQEFPYSDYINNVGIGAFPMLPGQTNQWLKDYFKSQLLGFEYYSDSVLDSYNVAREQKSANIPFNSI